MFTLLQGLWKYFFRKEEYYVVILGLDNAGKTVIIIYWRSYPASVRAHAWDATTT